MKSQLKSIQLSQLKPNPFRDMSRYPISAEKIKHLRDSMRETGLWLDRTSAGNVWKGLTAHFKPERLKNLNFQMFCFQKVARWLANDFWRTLGKIILRWAMIPVTRCAEPIRLWPATFF